MVLLQHAVLDMLTELARNRHNQRAEIFAPVVRVNRVSDVKPVYAFHHAEPADLDLIVQYDSGESLHVTKIRAFLEREHLDIGYCQAVEGGDFFLFVCIHFFYLLFVVLYVHNIHNIFNFVKTKNQGKMIFFAYVQLAVILFVGFFVTKKIIFWLQSLTNRKI